MLAITLPPPPVDSLVIAYSGGKDSLALLDLCYRELKSTPTPARLSKLAVFFMEFLPGLDYSDYYCGLAERRYGLRVHRYQHWGISLAFRSGVFLPFPINVPKVGLVDIERQVRSDTGIEWIAYGYKSIDSLQRRAWLNKWPDGLNAARRICAPLKAWNNTDVQSYLQRRHIPVLVTSGGHGGRRVSGLDLTPGCMKYMRDTWPGDYERILRVFPYAGAQAGREASIPVRRKAGRPRKVRDVEVDVDVDVEVDVDVDITREVDPDPEANPCV